MRVKKILIMLLLVLTFSACGKQSGEAGAQGGDADTVEEVKKSETYKWIYTSPDSVMYYANEDEEICSFSGYKELGTYFYHNVNFGRDNSRNWVLIDIEGNNIVEPGTYDYMERENEEYFKVRNDTENGDQCGIIDYRGNVIIPLEYERTKCYESAAFGGDPCITYFVAETKEGEYVLFTEGGIEITRTTQEFSQYDVFVYEPYNEKCIPTVRFEDTVYNLNDGKEILRVADGDVYAYNFYYEKDTNTLTVYDENFAVKEKITDLDIGDTFFFEKPYNELFRVRSNENYYFTRELTVEKIVVDTTHHVLANGEEYRSEIDVEAEEVHIYNAAREEVCTPSYYDSNGREVNRISVAGNYLVAVCGSHNKSAIIDMKTGAYLMDGIVYIAYSPENDLVIASQTSGDETAYTVFRENFTMKLPTGARCKMCDNGFWVLDWGSAKATFYDLNGVAQNEVTGITDSMQMRDNDYFLQCEDGTGKVINKEDGSITFSFEVSTCNIYSLYYAEGDNVGIIELEDGFYNHNGEKLIEKSVVQE